MSLPLSISVCFVPKWSKNTAKFLLKFMVLKDPTVLSWQLLYLSSVCSNFYLVVCLPHPISLDLNI